MSATTEPSTDLLLALCCECGTTRTVSRRAAGRSLRCETCRKTTPHAAIGDDRAGDWREMLDHKKKPTLSVDDKLDVLRSVGVDVRDVDACATTGGDRAVITLWWYLDEDGGFIVEVHADASMEERGDALTDALEAVAAPHDHEWYVHHYEGRIMADVVFAIRTKGGAR